MRDGGGELPLLGHQPGGRQLLDDFGVDTDQSGWAHIAYSHDAPDLGGRGTYTGSAVQTGGSRAGYAN